MGNATTWDWPAIKAELHRRGMTLSELAKRAGVSHGSFSHVATRLNYPAQTAIAEFIGEKPETLWPSRYPKKTSSILNTAKNPRKESQKGYADADKARAA